MLRLLLLLGAMAWAPLGECLQDTAQSFADTVERACRLSGVVQDVKVLDQDIQQLAQEFERNRRSGSFQADQCHVVCAMLAQLLQSGRSELVQLYYYFVDSYFDDARKNFLQQTTGFDWDRSGTRQANATERSIYEAGQKAYGLTEALLKGRWFFQDNSHSHRDLWDVNFGNNGWRFQKSWVDAFLRFNHDPLLVLTVHPNLWQEFSRVEPSSMKILGRICDFSETGNPGVKNILRGAAGLRTVCEHYLGLPDFGREHLWEFINLVRDPDLQEDERSGNPQLVGIVLQDAIDRWHNRNRRESRLWEKVREKVDRLRVQSRQQEAAKGGYSYASPSFGLPPFLAHDEQTTSSLIDEFYALWQKNPHVWVMVCRDIERLIALEGSVLSPQGEKGMRALLDFQTECVRLIEEVEAQLQSDPTVSLEKDLREKLESDPQNSELWRLIREAEEESQKNPHVRDLRERIEVLRRAQFLMFEGDDDYARSKDFSVRLIREMSQRSARTRHFFERVLERMYREGDRELLSIQAIGEYVQVLPLVEEIQRKEGVLQNELENQRLEDEISGVEQHRLRQKERQRSMLGGFEELLSLDPRLAQFKDGLFTAIESCEDEIWMRYFFPAVFGPDSRDARVRVPLNQIQTFLSYVPRMYAWKSFAAEEGDLWATCYATVEGMMESVMPIKDVNAFVEFVHSRMDNVFDNPSGQEAQAILVKLKELGPRIEAARRQIEERS